MKNILLIVLESLRYDTFASVKPKNMMDIGKLYLAHSAADWTLPSVMSMMTGMLPYSELGQPMRKEFMKKGNIINEGFWIPYAMQNMGRNTMANVSIPWLEMVNRGWDNFIMTYGYRNAKYMPEILEKLREPFFCYFHVGDTHMPYGIEKGESIANTKNIEEYNRGKDNAIADNMDAMKSAQIRMLLYIDNMVGMFMEKIPIGTRVIITADHGELFGEEHKFGHGCHFHTKVFEVPLIVGDL